MQYAFETRTFRLDRTIKRSLYRLSYHGCKYPECFSVKRNAVVPKRASFIVEYSKALSACHLHMLRSLQVNQLHFYVPPKIFSEPSRTIQSHLSFSRSIFLYYTICAYVFLIGKLSLTALPAALSLSILYFPKLV